MAESETIKVQKDLYMLRQKEYKSELADLVIIWNDQKASEARPDTR
jgi:hypothetical protein